MDAKARTQRSLVIVCLPFTSIFFALSPSSLVPTSTERNFHQQRAPRLRQPTTTCQGEVQLNTRARAHHKEFPGGQPRALYVGRIVYDGSFSNILIGVYLPAGG